MKIALTAVLAVTPYLVHAGGSNYGIAPGSLTNFTGKVSEWPVPTPRFARDPAVAPDGSIFIAVMSGNKIARFDTPTQTFREWEMPAGHRPHGLLVDKQGMVWTTGNGNGTIGKLDPKTEQMSEVDMGRSSRPRRVATAPDGMPWVANYGNGMLAKLDPAAMKVVKTYQLPGGDAGAYAVNTDGAGMVWVNEINLDTVVRFDPKTEHMRVVKLPSTNVGIRKMVVDAQGRLWYMGSHNGRLGVVE